MPESPEEAKKRYLRELEGKNVQYYSVLLAAWIETRMERDRTLVMLSAAAIGLLVTILTAVGLPRLWMVLLYVGAFAGFLLTIWTAIQIYKLNSEKIGHELRGSEAPNYRQINLEPYDRLSVAGFLVGTIFAIVIGISSAIVSFYSQKEVPMGTEDRMQPDPGETRSLQGIENLRPQAPQAEQPAPPAAPSPQPSPAPTPPSAPPAKN